MSISLSSLHPVHVKWVFSHIIEQSLASDIDSDLLGGFIRILVKLDSSPLCKMEKGYLFAIAWYEWDAFLGKEEPEISNIQWKSFR